MHAIAQPTNEAILRDLEQAIFRLADAVDDEPQIAAALRRFARGLPEVPPGPVHRDDVRDALCHALDEGALDPRDFDWLMVAEARGRRRRGLAAAQPPVPGSLTS